MSALYGTLSVVLLVAALVMALIVRPPPPPSIAELGPSPQEQIEEARENQAAGSGSGDLAAAAEEEEQNQTSTQHGDPSATTTPPTTSSSPPEVPPARRCFGDPPRQTEDPHSPPCVFEIFEGDNGGNTASGVTGTEVRIVINNTAVVEEYAEPLIEHFNRRYEFYGRRIALVAYNDSGGDAGSSENKAAAEDDVSHGPFAVVARRVLGGSQAYYSRLAEERIHSIASVSPNVTSDELNNGLFWSTSPTRDLREGALAEFVCKNLVGKVARHAGEDDLKESSRKFAIAVGGTDKEGWLSPDILRDKLRRCGAQFEVHEYSSNTRAQKLQELKSEGFTTIISAGAQNYDWELLKTASILRYFPEWLGWGQFLEVESFWSNPRYSDQAKQAFGITPSVRVRPIAEMPACWAAEYGGKSCNASWVDIIEELYKGIRLMASGVQGAGPTLTPETFRQALWDMVWPNPKPGRPPYWQQRVSLGPGDPVFYDDYAIWSWNENLPQQHDSGDGRGSFCYLDRGGRFVPGSFPSNADRRLFHEEPCR